MILRRVIAHFRKQEWTAIGLDFLIVVVGVFIGIQVSNWNDARAERSIADHHLTEIAEDLQAHLGFHDALYGSAVGRIAAVDLIYERAFGSALPDKLTISTETLDAPPIFLMMYATTSWAGLIWFASPLARATDMNP